MADARIYSIPFRFRKVENLHILFWLVKDACWALNFKVPAIVMIVPTMSVALLIAWQTRHIHSELLHNVAVAPWITANCTWMIGEFFQWDENLWGAYGLRQASVIPFALGLLVLGYYYLVLAPDKAFRERMAARTAEAIERERNPDRAD
jgi:hypothetical protein